MIEDILKSTFITKLFEILITVIMTIVGIILIPVSIIINTYFPDFDQALSLLADTFDYIMYYAGWILSAFAIPTLVISAMIGYYTFVLMTKTLAWPFKIGLQWFKAFK